MREGADASDDGFRVEDGSGPVGVGVWVTEQRIYRGGAERVVAAGDDFVEIHEGYVLFFGDGLSPSAVRVGVATDVTVDPDFARDK